MVKCKYCHASIPDEKQVCPDCKQAQSDTSIFLADNEQTPTQPLLAHNGDNRTSLALSDAGTFLSNAEHGTHLQAHVEHGMHSQAHVEHGTHLQPHVEHGTHLQPHVEHGMHPQAHGNHGTHLQAHATHGAHLQAHATHGAHLQAHATHLQANVTHGTRYGKPIRRLKLSQGLQPSVLTVAVSSVVVIAVIAASMVLVVPFVWPLIFPNNTHSGNPSVSMPTTIDLGQNFVLQGSHFVPHSQVTITIDTPTLRADRDSTSGLSGAEGNISRTFSLLMQQPPTQHMQSGQGYATATVDTDGKFSIRVPIDSHWSEGSQHTLYVLGKDGKVLANGKFSIKKGNNARVQPSPTAEPSTPCISVDQSSLSFTAQQGGSGLGGQSFTVINCGDAGTITTSLNTDKGQSWLGADNGGRLDTSGQLAINVSVNTQGLSVGQYTGHVNVTLTDTHNANASQQVTVNLTISAPPCITVQPTALSFTAQQGANNPGSQSFAITNCGNAGAVTTSISTNNGGSWLSADKGNTLASPGQLGINVSVNTQGLTANQYTGSIKVTLTDANGATATKQVTVNLAVSPPCTLSVNSTPLSFTAEPGGNNPAAQSVNVVSSCAGTITTSVSTNNGGSWLSADKGNTLSSPGQLGINVSVNTQGLSPSQYAGSVKVTLKDAQGVTTTQQVIVNLAVSPPCTISVNPSSLSFTAEQGGNNPNAQSFQVTSKCTGQVATSISTNDGGAWLSADNGGQLSTSNPLGINVSVNTQGLTTNQYTGYVNVTLTDANGATATQQVIVNLAVSAPCTLSVNPPSLSFTANQGGNNPSPQSFQVTSTCTGQATTSVSTTDGGSWLSADNGGQATASTPLGINVSVNTQGLTASQYTGSVKVTVKDANGATATQQVTVNLKMTTVLNEDFENSAPGWTTTGFWHIQDHPESISVKNPDINPNLVTLPDSGQLPAAYGGTHAAWFGEASTGTFCGSDFNTISQSPQNGCASSQIHSGELTSPVFSLAGASSAQVQFQTWWEIESVASSDYDRMWVEYSIDGGSNWSLAGKENPTSSSEGGAPNKSYTDNGLGQPAQWKQSSFDLSGAVGHASVQIRFQFDTGDTLYNGFRGWLVDNVQVVTNPQLGITTNQNPVAILSTGTPQLNVAVSSANLSDMVTYLATLICDYYSDDDRRNCYPLFWIR